MNTLRRWKLLAALLLAGAWVPVTVTCEPGHGVLQVTGDWASDVVVVDDGYYDDGCCGYWGDGDFSFDFFGSHHDDD